MISFEIIIIFGVLVLFFGLPIMVKSINYPASFHFSPLAQKSLPIEIREYFRLKKEELGGRGFYLVETFQVPEIENTNYSQVYNHGQGHIATLSVIIHSEKDQRQYYTEFLTQFEAGPTLITKSSSSFDMFYQPAGIFSVNYYKLKGTQSLYERHQALLSRFDQDALKYRSIPDNNLLPFLEGIQQQILEYQQARGVLKLDETTHKLRASYRLVLSILSHFLSLIDIDTTPRMKIGAFIFGFLTLVAAEFLSSVWIGGSEEQSLMLRFILGALFITGGGLTGSLFLRKSVPWSALSGMIPTGYIILTRPDFFLIVFDVFMLYILGGWFGNRLKIFRNMEGEIENLLIPGSALAIVLFIFLVSG
ncbi:hypothetical protein ACFL27_19200 [candidate division CSSED10-310 bacterium]|uniref:Uncharacterized protein n=1 Tax=candidate division CSSED10-310 bacterium TaxID=2855610 RepID=A0ABV6Z1L9_UNCC1